MAVFCFSHIVHCPIGKFNWWIYFFVQFLHHDLDDLITKSVHTFLYPNGCVPVFCFTYDPYRSGILQLHEWHRYGTKNTYSFFFHARSWYRVGTHFGILMVMVLVFIQNPPWWVYLNIHYHRGFVKGVCIIYYLYRMYLIYYNVLI
jgi:hypothetical protein